MQSHIPDALMCAGLLLLSTVACKTPLPYLPVPLTDALYNAPLQSPHAPCPEGMLYIEADYCTKLTHTCLKTGPSKPRHPRRCLLYAEDGSSCTGSLRRQRFCIDKYEYPNTKDAHPPVMIHAGDADHLCRQQGKRLCWESEWTLACEGPQQRPYPHGYKRDATRCNIDRPFIPPHPKELLSRDPARSDAELRNLDQGLPSGSMAECVSDHGVFDLTGNFSEWVYLETRRGRGSWAGTKGGFWAPVRNSCRLTSVAHPEGWRNYPLSTRCCRDPAQDTQDTQDTLETADATSPPRWLPPSPRIPTRWLQGPFSPGWTPAPQSQPGWTPAPQSQPPQNAMK